MGRKHSFKFLDQDLNRQLASLLKKAKIAHSIDEDGRVHYGSDEEEVVENDKISAIREKVFPSWQVITCPPGWTSRYRDYMARRHIPFREELSNGQHWFLIPRHCRPHAWKLRRE